ncbi:hypothetical protein PROFUN_10360 [Planoprotostelium fungivorum]|uniref:Uncharacterized protein n=1 Tax=Planoprotostelium fungivorum TaxID=1890364 RepID=A0A2P6NE03_9EUKA|nr:hypothetical protein PROFUN_10360 [Planoprotostelium fungivorum]
MSECDLLKVVVSVFRLTPEASYLCSLVVDDRRLSDGSLAPVLHGPPKEIFASIPCKRKRGPLRVEIAHRRVRLEECKHHIDHDPIWTWPDVLYAQQRYTSMAFKGYRSTGDAAIAFKVTNSLGIPETSSTINSSSNSIDASSSQATSSLLPSYLLSPNVATLNIMILFRDGASSYSRTTSG